MATFEATTHPVTFAHMEGRTKTVYVVPRTAHYESMTMGDRIEFDHLGSITIGAIRKFSSLRQMLEWEGVSNVAPGIDDIEEAIEWVRNTPEWDSKAEESKGVIALRVRSAKRKS
jgi:ASC-1-like (ASCH) protein